jgi:hypothetical protein
MACKRSAVRSRLPPPKIRGREAQLKKEHHLPMLQFEASKNAVKRVAFRLVQGFDPIV